MQKTLVYETAGRGTLDITADINDTLSGSSVTTGLCHVFIRHTSTSLMICENVDPDVRGDVERWLQQAVRDGDPMFEHDKEGDDDMSGHIRSIFTGMDLTVPITDGALNLGVWQGIYLYEHRYRGRRREVVITTFAAS